MTASPRYFKELGDTVPVCADRDTLDQVAQLFAATQAHRVVVLDAGDYPVGLIQLPKLLPHILAGRSGQMAIVDLQPSVVEPLPAVAEPDHKADHQSD
jgi:CBS domain containing-hemolysin-like protein